MRAQDIIRTVLDLLDQSEQDLAIDSSEEIVNEPGEQNSRFRQILDLLSNNDVMPTANTPNEQYATVDSVTTNAGGGLNGPKHVDDIRIKDPRGYE